MFLNANLFFFKVTDIAGLIRGASRGEGLGNAFLSHIRSVDGIAEVVRVFEDSDITHVEDSVDPVRDLDIILNELIEKDIETAQKALEAAQKGLRGNEKNKTKLLELEVIQKIVDMLKERRQVRFGDWKANEVGTFFYFLFFIKQLRNHFFLINFSKG